VSQDIFDEAIYGGSAPIHTQRVNIGLNSSTLAVAVGLTVVIFACGTVLGLNLAKQAQMDSDYRTMKTQVALLERRLMDKEALDILNGTRLQSDTEFGPTGNLQRMKPK
jgi:hypothetical protein